MSRRCVRENAVIARSQRVRPSWPARGQAPRRSNPDRIRGNSLDCFASLAMTSPDSKQEGHIMASIHKDIPIDAPAHEGWDAVRDCGALHTRLVPGFLLDTKLDGDVRIVTF